MTEPRKPIRNSANTLVAIVTALAASTGGAMAHAAADDELTKTQSLVLRLKISSEEFALLTDQKIEDHISELLSDRGLTANEKTRLEFHVEESTVDLHCFDCVIIDRELFAARSTPLNLEGSGL